MTLSVHREPPIRYNSLPVSQVMHFHFRTDHSSFTFNSLSTALGKRQWPSWWSPSRGRSRRWLWTRGRRSPCSPHCRGRPSRSKRCRRPEMKRNVGLKIIIEFRSFLVDESEKRGIFPPKNRALEKRNLNYCLWCERKWINDMILYGYIFMPSRSMRNKIIRTHFITLVLIV